MDLLKDLNEQQRRAVLHTEGPLLVIAGAGSGKTRVLMYRIAYLVRHKGIDPGNILAVTFTNKAADEMRSRASQLLGNECKGMWISTFHAGCARILRTHGEAAGYKKHFVIFDETDQLSLIKTCLKELDASRFGITPYAVRALIDKAKNNACSYEQVLPRSSPAAEIMKMVVERYEATLRASNAFDFGDLINAARLLLETYPDILHIYRRTFRYVMVDEYQDTNRAQHLFLKALIPQGGNVCVVGDDDQSIYRWRGAHVANLLDFEKDFPGTTVITLEQNYRSTKTILEAAQHVAMGNRLRRPKRLWTENERGEKITYAACDDPLGEARYVAEQVLRLVRSGRFMFKDIGVFFRTNAQSRPFEEVFLNSRIPYVLIGTLRFFERTEIKDVIAYLRILHNPDDSISLSRILNKPPRGIGDATVKELNDLARTQHLSLWGALHLSVEKQTVSRTALHRIDAFCATIRSLRALLDTRISLHELLRRAVDATGYRDYLQSHEAEEAQRRLENIAELARTVHEFDVSFSAETTSSALEAFLERVALISDADTYNEKADCVALMTLHCAKGLEFPVVFLVGFEEGIIPHERSCVSQEELAEERRLCYVGMTRAMKKLYLTSVAERTYFGSPRQMVVSPFLDDIPERLIKSENYRFPHRCTGIEQIHSHCEPFAMGVRLQPHKKGKGLVRETSQFKVGDRIQHRELGQGVVRKVEGQGDREKITVQFVYAGIRKLMVSHAPITKLS